MENVDFLPDRIRQQRARRRRLIRRCYLLAVCAAGLVALGYARQGLIRHAHAELAALNDRSANVSRQIDMLGILERQQADLLIKKRIDDQLGSRANALQIMAELERLTPQSISLTSMLLEGVEVRQSVQRPGVSGEPRTERTVPRVRLAVTGLAPNDVDIATFIGQLSTSPLFEDVNMGYAKTTTFRDRPAREFQASCYLAR